MAKKKRSAPQRRAVRSQEIEQWLNRATRLLADADYQGAITIARRVLLKPSASPAQRAEALDRIGGAHLMLQDYDAAYAAISEALLISPSDSCLWYNRGLTCRFTMRSGQALRDFERAVELEQDEEFRRRFDEELRFSRQIAEQSLALRGPSFTLDKLIDQEELFQSAVRMMAARQWAQAEETFRRVIAMGDCLPQPWGNIGACLIMQQRYDEAEDALRRALEIDPRYEYARANLAALPRMRRSPLPPMSQISGPFDGQNIKKGITFRLGK